ncbi:MAG: DNA pilot protein [Microvirus sp.]|nr:MAG: DNA pilot protein [Microvirus sp.]
MGDTLPGQIIGAGVDLISSIGNMNLQQQNLDYQKNLQQQIFQREDNSITRRIADLKANGLSPVLAAGQGANAGQAIQTQAPQMAPINAQDRFLKGIGAEIAQKDIDLKNAQIEQTKANTAFINTQNAGSTGMQPLQQEALKLANLFQSETIGTRKSQLELEVEGKQIANTLNSALQSGIIQKQQLDLSGQQIDNINKALDTKLKNSQLDSNKLSQIQQTINNFVNESTKNAQVSMVQKDLMSKIIAMDLMDNTKKIQGGQITMLEQQANYYKKFGVSDANIKTILDVLKTMSSIAGDALQFGKGKL